MTTVDLPPQLDASAAKAQLAALCRALDALPRGSVCRLNAAGVQRFDSAGLALLLACRRHAQAHGKTLHVVQWPAKLQSLAQVYGVLEWLQHPPRQNPRPRCCQRGLTFPLRPLLRCSICKQGPP